MGRTRAQAFAEKVRDVTEVLAGLDRPQAPRHRMDMRVAYHDACHLGHAQGVRQPPRDLLEAIPGVTLVPVAESDICCGSAGIFNLVQPEMAAELGRRKAADDRRRQAGYHRDDQSRVHAADRRGVPGRRPGSPDRSRGRNSRRVDPEWSCRLSCSAGLQPRRAQA